jgi:hypothetical protein
MIVACVKVGDKFGDEYVTKLRDGVRRHLHRDHKFICFTDRAVAGVDCLPPPSDLPTWWAKLGLFRLGQPMLYFDLDVVITGDLAPLCDWNEFGIIKDWWLPGFNSSVMRLTGTETHVWACFHQSLMTSLPFGDQQWITMQMSQARTFPPQWFPSYKASRCFDDSPHGALAVIFHGRPMPHECGGWVAEQWANQEQKA